MPKTSLMIPTQDAAMEPYPEFFALAKRDGVNIPERLLPEIRSELALLRSHVGIVNAALREGAEPSLIQVMPQEKP